jgi:4'-phosphopantetheinyl transferase
MTVIPEVSWASGPERPRLDAGVVDVWRADLTEAGEGLDALLSDEERARAERMPNERARGMWTRSHGVLRALLARYLGADTDPAALQFAAGAHGKPALAGQSSRGATVEEGARPARVERMQFNLSHSGGLALYAFAAGPAVGVDVELDRRPIDEVAIASRTFGAAEASRLRALDPRTRRHEFLRAWVRHEARLKCLGVGIGGEGTASGESRPWIAELAIGPEAAGAVAVDVAPRALRCWDWSA